MKLAVIGAGWAGLAAAVEATRAGHSVTVFEAARLPGGRARALAATLPDGRELRLDNGQHILIGAYRETLALMRFVGVDLDAALLALPLVLRFPDGSGLRFAAKLRAPADAFIGIVTARGWNWRDKASLLRASLRWQRARFNCAAHETVAELCRMLTPRVRGELVEPLCVAALNTPTDRASGQVFLRVLRDSLFGAGYGRWAGSNLLLPRVDLGACFPEAAADWLRAHGGRLVFGRRVAALARDARGGWRVNEGDDDERFDAVVIATAPWDAARLIESAAPDASDDDAGVREWLARTRALRFEPIATVYALADPPVRLAEPMLSLRSGSGSGSGSDAAAPAQFVFDRAQLGGVPGLLAFVASTSGDAPRAVLEAAVAEQARAQLGTARLSVLRTVVEKRATFACTPDLARPAQRIAAGLFACGDYVAGPYPATLEGAVRSALAAVQELQGLPHPFSSIRKQKTTQ